MRDKRFIAEHRGGPLAREQHRLLVQWARTCAEHVFPLLGQKPDGKLLHAIAVAEEWEAGKASVGDARKASVALLALARELSDPVAVAVTRATGHAVATAHMADHSLRAAEYALKAVKYAKQPAETELEWQQARLPQEIAELVITARSISRAGQNKQA